MKKEAHESWTLRHEEIRKKIHSSTLLLIISGAVLSFRFGATRMVHRWARYGVWGFHLVGKKSKTKGGPNGFFEEPISYFPTDRHFTLLRAKAKRTPSSY